MRWNGFMVATTGCPLTMTRLSMERPSSRRLLMNCKIRRCCHSFDFRFKSFWQPMKEENLWHAPSSLTRSLPKLSTNGRFLQCSCRVFCLILVSSWSPQALVLICVVVWSAECRVTRSSCSVFSASSTQIPTRLQF